MENQNQSVFFKAIRQSIKARGLWGGISIAMLLARSRTKTWFGAHHKIVINLVMLGLFAGACFMAYWVLTRHGRIASAGSVWGITVLLAAALASAIVSLSHFVVQRAYRRIILMKTIQFTFFAVLVGGLGYLGYEAWADLYSKQPAEATLMALIAAVVLYGLSDVTSLLARSAMVKTMAVPDIKELPSLSDEGKYRAGIHEAGHALCYGLCDGVPEDAYVVIEQDMNELIGGHVNLPEPREPTDFTRPHIEWELLILMAGVAAEEEIFGDGSMLGGGDMSAFNMHAAIYLMAGHGEVFEMTPETELDMTTNRAAIGRLREEFRSRAREFIRANRELVESLAKELCAVEFMDCEGIAAMAGKVAVPDKYTRVRWPATLAVLKQ